MAKITGMAWTTLDMDDELGAPQDIRSATTTLEWSTPRNPLEGTGIDKSAMERQHGLADFQATPSGIADFATSDAPHDVFKDLSGTRTLTLGIGGASLANEVLVTDYNFNRADDASLKWTAPCVLQSGTVPTWT